MTESSASNIPLNEVTLVNKRYYKTIRQYMKALEVTGKEPTVGDMIETMVQLGNEDYINAFPASFKPKTREVPFEDHPSVPHEVAHLCLGLAHTSQQEFFVLPFQIGLKMGLSEFLPKDVTALHDRYAKGLVSFKASAEKYTDEQHFPQPISKRTLAINFAAGLYLREKITQYMLKVYGGDYATKVAFCEEYAHSDHTPFVPKSPNLDYINTIFDAPYHLIEISPKEWRSIIAVATGKATPEQSDYPQRMRPIKTALVNTDFFYDSKKERDAGTGAAR